MYVPDHFREDRPDVLHDAMRGIGFATLVTAGPGRQSSAHAAGQDGVLRGHVARANPVWKAGDGAGAGDLPGAARLCLAQLVSVSKAETGKAVPTWNYITVHAQGHASAGSRMPTGCAPMSPR